MPHESKKVKKAIDQLNLLVKDLEYFYGGNEKFKEIKKMHNCIESTLHELGIEKKIDHARFSSKFKKLFAKENVVLKEKLARDEKEIKELNSKIKRLEKNG